MWVGGRAGVGFSQANYFLDMTTKAQAKKEKKIDKLNFIEMKNFVHQRVLLRESKDNPQDGRKPHVPDLTGE